MRGSAAIPVLSDEMKEYLLFQWAAQEPPLQVTSKYSVSSRLFPLIRQGRIPHTQFRQIN